MGKYQPWWLALCVVAVLCAADFVSMLFTGVTLFYDTPDHAYFMGRIFVGFMTGSSALITAQAKMHTKAAK